MELPCYDCELRDEYRLEGGTFSEVFRVRITTNDGEKIAVCKLPSPREGREVASSRSDAERERRALQIVGQGEHDNVIRLLGIHTSGGLILENIPSSFTYMRYLEKKDFKFNWPILLNMLYQMADALDFCHNRQVYHCDLKPDNVFLLFPDDANAAPIVKVADFDVAVFPSFQNAKPYYRYSLAYRAPELQNEGQEWRKLSKEYKGRCDVFSFGAILSQTVSRKPPFYGNDTMEFVREITQRKGECFLKLTEKLIRECQVPNGYNELLMLCREASPKDRCDFAAVMGKISEMKSCIFGSLGLTWDHASARTDDVDLEACKLQSKRKGFQDATREFLSTAKPKLEEGWKRQGRLEGQLHYRHKFKTNMTEVVEGVKHLEEKLAIADEETETMNRGMAETETLHDILPVPYCSVQANQSIANRDAGRPFEGATASASSVKDESKVAARSERSDLQESVDVMSEEIRRLSSLLLELNFKHDASSCRFEERLREVVTRQKQQENIMTRIESSQVNRNSVTLQHILSEFYNRAGNESIGITELMNALQNKKKVMTENIGLGMAVEVDHTMSKIFVGSDETDVDHVENEKEFGEAEKKEPSDEEDLYS